MQNQAQSLFPSCFAHWVWKDGWHWVANPLACYKAQDRDFP